MNDKDIEESRKIAEMECKIDELGEVLTYMQKSQNRLRETILHMDMALQNHSKRPQGPSVSSKMEAVQGSREEGSYDPKADPKNAVFETLTETQNLLFLRLGALLMESGRDRIPFKTLAQETYPGKDYAAIRSTISEYLGILVDFGLVNKIRKGRNSYVQLTKKGMEHFNKQKQPIEKKATKKPSKEQN